MPTLAAPARPPPPPLLAARPRSSTFTTFSFPKRFVCIRNAKRRFFVTAASFDGRRPSKKSVLSDLIQEIEPLDVSIIQKDVPGDTLDAMKRTISGMLGLLPSDQFHVLVEAFWEPLSKLLVSSMMTGYTLRNAEYRLCLERNLGIHDGYSEKQRQENTTLGHEVLLDENTKIFNFSRRNELLSKSIKFDEDLSLKMDDLDLGEMTPEARQYILHLQSRVSLAKSELHEIIRKNAALHMPHFVGEEKNDLLDYLRSLEPEKVAELSEPTSSESQETIQCVVHGLLATLSPKMHSKAAQWGNDTAQTLKFSEDSAEIVENASLQFQPLISVTRDYLARLIFWCMLLGHYLKGLEYRLELMQVLTLSADADPHTDQSVP